MKIWKPVGRKIYKIELKMPRCLDISFSAIEHIARPAGVYNKFNNHCVSPSVHGQLLKMPITLETHDLF